MAATAPNRASPGGQILVPLIVAWYVVSFAGIVLNKTLLSPGSLREVDPRTLTLVQTGCTALFGGLSQTILSGGAGVWSMLAGKEAAGATSSDRRREGLWTFALLGIFRFLTIVLGLVSLRCVAASFTETVKASSPLFTVIATFILTRERTPATVLMTLLPVTGGLMVASGTELSFTWIGFLAAVGANLVECVQYVFCKELLKPVGAHGVPRYTSFQLQYTSAVAAFLVQLPFFMLAFLQDTRLQFPSDAVTLGLLVVNGLIYYVQSLLAFEVMSHLTPVTVSVLNTTKRAMIIVLSAMWFGNPVRLSTWFGTAATVAGAGWYSQTNVQLSSAKGEDIAVSGGRDSSAGEASPATSRPALSSTPCARRSVGYRGELAAAFVATSRRGRCRTAPGSKGALQQRRRGSVGAAFCAVVSCVALKPDAYWTTDLGRRSDGIAESASLVRSDGASSDAEEGGALSAGPTVPSWRATSEARGWQQLHRRSGTDQRQAVAVRKQPRWTPMLARQVSTFVRPRSRRDERRARAAARL